MAASYLFPRFPEPTSTSSSTSTSGGTSSSSGGNAFVSLIASPFDSEFQAKSITSAIIFSLTLTIAIIFGFCLIRPHNNVVYAPRAKHADSKHAPPSIQPGLFGWVRAVMSTKEAELVERVGLDAALFMRFTRMMRNIFTVLAVLGCGILIPTTLVASNNASSGDGLGFFLRLTPSYMWGSQGFWAYVIIAYLFDGVIMYFLWRNYRAVLRLRRAYFDGSEYQRSLHARTLLVSDIPRQLRSDDGIVRITEEVKATGDIPRAAIGRNVKDLPDLIEEHEETVRRLEKHLARYFKNPNALPAKRPTCKVNKNDKAYTKGQQVDAIDYLTSRIKELEIEIKEVRLTVDKRDAMSYGFASYESISEAHTVAYVARKGGPEQTIIRLAPKPNDLIWRNLPMLKKERNWQNFINNLWVALLTVIWVVPNILIAVFLSNLSNLGLVWHAFQKSLYANQTVWAIVQGIVPPAITTLFYLLLPAIFRRLVTRAGDVTKTSRERHVMHKLFSFFLFNNLIVFSLFSAAWRFIASLVSAGKEGDGFLKAVENAHPLRQIVGSLITVSTYWCSWLLQRNLGAAIDLGQVVRLTWGWIQRRYLSPTPRELIELSAPQPFDYASYYNYFLFYGAVALCFGGLQPLALAITALYFWMDSFAKKYMILYIFITKYESGGAFWRTLFNRMLVNMALSNLVIALLVVAYGDFSANWSMLAAMAPLPFLIGAFKWYCATTFDDPIHYYHTGKAMRDEELMHDEQKRRKGDRVGPRYGHPALYKPLMTPMVAAKSQHLLKSVYTGRTSVEEPRAYGEFGDVYMDAMDSSQPGKTRVPGTSAPFELVQDHQMDFEHWKERPEFRDEAGGDGELFGRPADLMRPDTSGGSSILTGRTRTGTWDSSRSGSHTRDQSRDSDGEVDAAGVVYPRGYHQTPMLREHSPAGGSDYGDVPSRRPVPRKVDSREALVQSAARMGRSPPPNAPAPGGYGPITYGAGTPGDSEEEITSYDYFRRQRGR